jgi:hypothetical protein
MKRFMVQLLYVIPFFLIMGGTNYFLDEQLVFHKEKLKKVVEWLQEGDTVYGVTHVHKPFIQKHYVETVNEVRDIVVIGASDCSHIGESLFPGKDVYTHWKPGAGLFFQTAMIKLYEERGMLPKEVILSLRPNILENHGARSAEYFSRPFNEKLKELGAPELTVEHPKLNHLHDQIIKLFSVKYMVYNLSTNNHEIGLVKTFKERFIMFPDGSVMNNFKEIEKINSKIIQEAMVFYINAYKNPKPTLIELHQKLIEDLKTKGVKVSFFILPFHPLLMANENYDRDIRNWEKEVKQLSKKLDVDIIGGVSPGEFGLVKDDFYDITHIKSTGMQKIFNAN